MALSSKSKKKSKQHQQNIVVGEDGVSWIVDEAGNKIKKFRKKIRRRNSNNNDDNGESNSNANLQFDSSSCEPVPEKENENENENDLVKLQDGKMISFRTAATEKSSSHDSFSNSQKAEEDLSGAFSAHSKKSKKSKNIVEIDGQLWRTDDDGNPLNKVRKKSAREGERERERLHKSEHVRKPDGSVISPSRSSKDDSKKKRTIKRGSKSVRNFRTISGNDSENDNASDDEEKTKTGTVDTTGTGSMQRPRPKLSRKQMSQPVLSSGSSKGEPRRGIARQRSGDLDMLMNQRVVDHARRQPPQSEKPTLGRSGKTLGKSLKNIFRSKSRDKERDTMKSLPEEESAELKPLPKDIREIDGVLWRVDQYGNKLNKVRKKSLTTGTWTSDDENEVLVPLSEHNNNNNNNPNFVDNSSDHSFGGFSSAEEFGGESNHRKGGRNLRKGRRTVLREDSFGDYSGKPDSESSIYLDGVSNHSSPKPGRAKLRSRSLDPGGSDHSNPFASVGDEDKKDVLMRLRESEQEVSRLLRVTSDQQDIIDDNEKDIKRLKKKLKQANTDKEDLADEIDRLADELEKKETMLLEERKKPKDHSNGSGGNNTASSNSNNDRGNSGSDRLVATICDLKQKKVSLEKRVEEEQARADAKMEAKEAEIEFLQQELDRMRSKQGDRQLQEAMCNSSSDDEDFWGETSRSPDQNRGSKSLVGKILGAHLQSQAETQASLQQQEIRDLQDRVCKLQISNEKLKNELRQASLAIKEDDDEEIRLAKEAAALAAAHAASQKPQSMRMPRRGSGGGVIPEGFRMQRRGSGGAAIPEGFRMQRRGSGGAAIPEGLKMQQRLSNDPVWWGR